MKKNILRCYFILSYIFIGLSLPASAENQVLNTQLFTPLSESLIDPFDLSPLHTGQQSLPAPLPSPVALQGPVVIAVPGLNFDELGWGPLEIGAFKKYFSSSINKAVRNKAISNKMSLDMTTALENYNKQYEGLAPAAVRQTGRAAYSTPVIDAYVSDALAKLPACADLTIVPFLWSRDPGDTERTVVRFIADLTNVFHAYRDTGRPIYVIAHSWGTVIMHDVLNRLSEYNSPVRIDKFITLGSPLVPGNKVIKAFAAWQITSEDIQETVKKPANVSLWINIWAKRDAISNNIYAADKNIQVDAGIGRPETRVERIMLSTPSKLIPAKQDLIGLINIGSWHSSYLDGFNLKLKTTGKTINVPAFQQYLAPLLTNNCLKPAK